VRVIARSSLVVDLNSGRWASGSGSRRRGLARGGGGSSGRVRRAGLDGLRLVRERALGDQHVASSVLHDVVADRAEQHTLHGAEAALADDQDINVLTLGLLADDDAGLTELDLANDVANLTYVKQARPHRD